MNDPSVKWPRARKAPRRHSGAQPCLAAMLLFLWSGFAQADDWASQQDDEASRSNSAFSASAPAAAAPAPGLQTLAYSQKITKVFQGITFTSDYDNGSLESLTESGTNTFSGTLHTDSGETGTAKYWFRFLIIGAAGRTLTINLDHSQNPRPVVRWDGGPWRRMTAAEAPSLSKMILTIPSGTSEAEVAFFFPLGYEETNQRTADYVRACSDATTTVIGQTYMGLNLWMASVTDPSIPSAGKRRVWVHARVHAGEATAVYAMLGLLRQITEASELGRQLRAGCLFTVIPTVNCDGVFLGHTRWDSQGIDPERQWTNPDRIPETAAMRTLVDSYMEGPNPIEVALNLHSSVNDFADSFFYMHTQPSTTASFEAKQQRYIDAVDHATPLFDNLSPMTSQINSIFIEGYFWNNWGENVMAMTEEGHYYQRITDQEFITGQDYEEIGAALASALVEYFNLPQAPPVSHPQAQWILY